MTGWDARALRGWFVILIINFGQNVTFTLSFARVIYFLQPPSTLPHQVHDEKPAASLLDFSPSVFVSFRLTGTHFVIPSQNFKSYVSTYIHTYIQNKTQRCVFFFLWLIKKKHKSMPEDEDEDMNSNEFREHNILSRPVQVFERFEVILLLW